MKERTRGKPRAGGPYGRFPAAILFALAVGLAVLPVMGGEPETPPAPVAPAAPAPVQPEAAPPPQAAAVPVQPAETPETKAAKAEAELKEKREQERQEILAKAELFVETADATVKSSLPYPLNLLFGVQIFSIALWRFVASAGLLVFGLFLLFLVSRRFRTARKLIETRETRAARGRWHLILNVAFLTLKNPIKLFILAIVLRSASGLIVTPYHPDVVWFCELLIYLGFVIYFFDLVGIVDQVYGDRIFHGSDRLMETVRPMILKGLRVVILCVAGLHIYQSVTGQTMVSLLAGLGIGGLALALASQATLQNLLGFAAIAMDKAFLVGDAVTISNYDGTIERVGLRSTLLRTYDGNSVVIPNSSAINSNVVNRNRRPFVRREIRLSLSPFNSHAKIVQAMDAVREVLDAHEGKVPGLPPVVRFVEYEPARFVIQALFWYDAEKPFFFDECSRVNLEICKRMSDLGVMFSER